MFDADAIIRFPERASGASCLFSRSRFAPAFLFEAYSCEAVLYIYQIHVSERRVLAPELDPLPNKRKNPKILSRF
jgi:hypothetical protein